MQIDRYSIGVAYKVIEKAIINELLKKEFLDICQYNNIINKIDDEISKINSKDTEQDSKSIENIVVKIKL